MEKSSLTKNEGFFSNRPIWIGLALGTLAELGVILLSSYHDPAYLIKLADATFHNLTAPPGVSYSDGFCYASLPLEILIRGIGGISLPIIGAIIGLVVGKKKNN